MPASVLLKALDGAWEWVGADRRAGIWHESLTCEADQWGPSKASFTLKRDPSQLFPDLGAFTDVDVYDNGVPVWSGRISDTPMNDAAHSVGVQCEGWQYHLDDDLYARQYLHTHLADYKDQRGMPGATLGAAALSAAGQVTADGNGVYLAWPNGTTVAVGTGICAVLDLGAGCTGKRVVASWESSANVPSANIVIIGADYPGNTYTTGTFDTAISFAHNTGASGTIAGTFTTARRYVHLILTLASAPGALPFDAYVKFTGVAVFAETAYESGFASLLTASTIIGDALNRATVLLSADRSGIATSSFVFPAFGASEPRTPREVVNAANAAHNQTTQVDVYRRPIFAASPTVAAFEIGSWPGATFEDASANSGDDIYNRVLVTGGSADGQGVTADRSASLVAILAGSAQAEPVSSPAFPNPSFAVNNASWTPSTGTAITRDTVTFNTTPASGRFDRGGGVVAAGDTLTTTLTGTFTAGVAYEISAYLRTSVAGAYPAMSVSVAGQVGASSAFPIASATFVQCRFYWIPTATVTGVVLTIAPWSTGAILHVDSASIGTVRPTVVDRRGFMRTKALSVSNDLITSLAVQVGDAFLASHRTTPLKGIVRATGRGAIRDVLTGQSVAPSWMLLHTMAMLRLSHRTDPDTGGLWRDGRIVGVKWTAEANTAEITLDSSRQSFEALLSRLSAVVGGG